MFSRLRAFATRIVSAFRPRERGQEEFDRELSSHLEFLTQENLEKGMSPEEAARAARVRLGGFAQLKEINRELRGLPLLDALAQDVRYAVRVLGKNPGFTTICILTLALAIGLNTAIFSVVYAVVLKPLPYPRAAELYNVFQQSERDATTQTGMSYLNMNDLRDQSGVFRGLAGVIAHELTLTGRGEPYIVSTADVTPDFFNVFEQQAILGRSFAPEDGKPGAAPTVILNEALWRNYFSADPKVIGSSINLDKRAFTIIGVMPAAFRYPLLNGSREIWIPLAQDPMFGSWLSRRGGHWLLVAGRVKPGVSAAEAQTQFKAIGARLAGEYAAEDSGWTFGMMPLQRLIDGDVRSPLCVLLGAVALVLLIGCANIANLLLTRATSRTREIAVRTALGASRGRIVRQFLSETTVLGILGGGAGIALAYGGVGALASYMPSSVPQLNPVRVDRVVLAFAIGVSAMAILLFGLAPAFLAAKCDPQRGLRESGARSGDGGAGRRVRRIFAGAVIALATVLLVAAGLLIRSFSKLTSVSPGFETAHLVKANIALPRAQYSTPQQWLAFANDLLAHVQAEPGMGKTAIAVPTPLADGFINLAFDIVGQPPRSASDSRTADYASVTPNYLDVLSIPLLSGRFFDQRDVMSSQYVTVVSAAMARAYFPNQNPIGQRISFAFPPDKPVSREIVGVIGDVHDESLGQDPKPMMYVPFAQSPLWGGDLIVNSTLPTSSVVKTIRADIMKLDKDLPAGDITTMAEVLSGNVAQPRFRTFLITLFAALALVLAAIGIFGVISHSVSSRTREIGIRVAMGASRGGILRMIFRETLVLAFWGLAVGLPAAFAASRVVGHLLFGVSPSDPVTLIAVAMGLLMVAALAGYLPARRAMRVDPLVALRHE